MDKYLERLNKVYTIAYKVLNHNIWAFDTSSKPTKLTNGQVGYQIEKIQCGKDGEFSAEVNGIEAIAAKDSKGIDYFLIGALCDDPQIMEFDASDVEIAAVVGRCAQITYDYLGIYTHAWE